jgi:hypothetical protein
MFKKEKLLLLALLALFISLDISYAADNMPSILPLKERATIINQWTKVRLNTILPELMRREGFDMWIIICREYNDDPVFFSLSGATEHYSQRLTMLVFYDCGKKEGVERIRISSYGIDDLYKLVWNPEKMSQWECLAKVVAERNPKRIGINESDLFSFGDGLSASLKKKLIKELGPKYSARLHSAERLAVGWLEKRIPEELEVYPYIVAIAHDIIAKAFSNKIITPGITTTEDVQWWMAQRISNLGLMSWFHPIVEIDRMGFRDVHKGVIQKGDLLFCDIGITYLRLNTDTQELAYILKESETDAPNGLKKALKIGNKLQDILMAEFKEGRTGNEVLMLALQKAKAMGIKPRIYTHPLGFHGHGAGPTIGLWEQQNGVPGQGDYTIFYDTCYAIELNIRTEIPEWGGQEVPIALEQDAAFTKEGIYFLDGRQTKFHLIK